MNKWRQIKWSLHPLFVMVLLLSMLTGYFIELVTLFAIVFVHEIGHVLMASGVGWKVTAVKLLPFGGVVEVEDSAGVTARDELLVAIAGPLQNVWMLLLAYLFGELGWWSVEWTAYFIEANLWIILFNLLPIMPLDGGKIAQALLSYRTSYYSCMLWSLRISVVSSAIVIAYAFLPVVFHTGGIKLNELMIGIFLLASNLTNLRYLPFLFYRFMLQRHKYIQQNNQILQKTSKVYPILISAKQPLYEGLKEYRRNRNNVLCVLPSAHEPYSLLFEPTVLNHYVQNFDVHRAAGDILR